MADTVNIEALEPSNQEESSNKQTPGKILREARFAEDKSEAQVASQLYLSRSVIRAIESDQYEKLPGTTFVRGYLRSYARLVNVPADKIMQAFDDLGIAKDHTPILAPVAKPKMQVGVSDKSIRWVTYVIVAALLALVIIWWRSHNEKIEDVVATPVDAESAIAAEAPAPTSAIVTDIEPIVGTDPSGSIDNKDETAGNQGANEKVMNSDQLNESKSTTPSTTQRYRRRAEAEQVMDPALT